MAIISNEPQQSGMPHRIKSFLKRSRTIGLPLLKQWRAFRGLTQEQLADRAGMSPGNISQLENGKIHYSQPGLQALAEALNCEPFHVLNVDPTKDEAIWSLWERATEAERAQIVAVSRALVKKAS